MSGPRANTLTGDQVAIIITALERLDRGAAVILGPPLATELASRLRGAGAVQLIEGTD